MKNPTGHSETKAVQGRQVAYREYPPASTQERKAQKKPEPHSEALGRACPSHFSSSIQQVQCWLNTNSEPGSAHAKSCSGSFICMWIELYMVAKRGQEREGACSLLE